jgi:hypothetical protein
VFRLRRFIRFGVIPGRCEAASPESILPDCDFKVFLRQTDGRPPDLSDIATPGEDHGLSANQRSRDAIRISLASLGATSKLQNAAPVTHVPIRRWRHRRQQLDLDLIDFTHRDLVCTHISAQVPGGLRRLGTY